MTHPPRPVTQAEACRVADRIYDEGRAMQARAAEEDAAVTAQPTREDLVADVSAAQMTVDEFERSLPSIPTAHRCLADAALADAQADLNAYDAADWALVRNLLDEHEVVWALRPGGWYADPEAEQTGTHMPRRAPDKHYCHIYGDSCNAEPCGTGATRSEALLDLARKVGALSNDTKPAGEAGEEKAT